MERHGGGKLRRGGGGVSGWCVTTQRGEHGADGVPPGLLHIFVAKCCGTSVGFSLEWVRQKGIGRIERVCVQVSGCTSAHVDGGTASGGERECAETPVHSRQEAA